MSVAQSLTGISTKHIEQHTTLLRLIGIQRITRRKDSLIKMKNHKIKKKIIKVDLAKTTKQIGISVDRHQKVKARAAEHNKSIKSFMEDLVDEYFSYD